MKAETADYLNKAKACIADAEQVATFTSPAYLGTGGVSRRFPCGRSVYLRAY
jgi:hypothetical protein